MASCASKTERSSWSATSAELGIRAPNVETRIGTLSGGNQQKAILARWLAREPRVLILDEPTKGIDIGAKAEIHRLIEQLARGGIAVLLISSELPELLALSDRVAVMRSGSVVSVLDRSQATKEAVTAHAAGYATPMPASAGSQTPERTSQGSSGASTESSRTRACCS